MYEFLTGIGISPIVANFIARPEWLHMGSATLLVIFTIGMAYIVRIELDPHIFGKRLSFSMVTERIVFWPAIATILLWTYYYPWDWPQTETQGFYWNKFTIGGALLLLAVMARAGSHYFLREKNRAEFFDQFPFYLMLIYQLFVPLVYYFQLERNGLMPKEGLGFSLACMFIGYFLVRILVGKPTHIPRNPVSLWLWFFIAWMLITVVFMPYRLAAVKNVIQWISFAACFLMGLAYIQDRRRRDFILLIFVITALLSTLWGLWKYFDLPYNLFQIVSPEEGADFFYKTPSAGRYFLLAGFFANPNYYGEFLNMTIFIGLGLFFAHNSLKMRTFLGAALAINIFEMVALYNRAGWLGMFVASILVLAGLYYGRVPVFKKISKTGLITGVVVIALILTITGRVFNERETDESPLSGTPLERLQSMTDFTEDETFRNRLTMWRAARFMMTDPEHFPQLLLFGGGFGFFEVEYLPYQTQVLETYNFEEWFHNVIPTFRAHNDHIQMLVEAGLIGTSFYALIFIMFFIYGFRFVRAEEDPGRKFIALAILAAVMCSLASAMFSFPFHKIQHGSLVFTIMAFLVVEIAQKNRIRKMLSEGADVSALEAGLPDKTDSRISRRKKKKRFEKEESARQIVSADEYPHEYFITIQKKFRIEHAIILMIPILFLMVYGVYTQIINFKSQYFVVRGISALRSYSNDAPEITKNNYNRLAAASFWRAYQLDPTNGRAEFFHGFALTKLGDYENTVKGIAHLEEGQILYPQSDTYYALAMGYETRKSQAEELVSRVEQEISRLQSLPENSTEGTDAEIETRIAELNEALVRYRDDIQYSQDRAIEAYATAAEYYPVKVEYYNDLIRLLEQEERYDEVIYWAERALIVDDWLIKKPPIRWQLYLSLGKAHWTLGNWALDNDDRETGFEHFNDALEALKASMELSSNVYYTYYFSGQIYEAYGDNAVDERRLDDARENYELARDMYVETFNKKDNHSGIPFNYAYFLLGRIYEKLGDTPRALEFYRQTMSVAGYSPATRTYQMARQRIFELTDTWEGVQPSDEELLDEPV